MGIESIIKICSITAVDCIHAHVTREHPEKYVCPRVLTFGVWSRSGTSPPCGSYTVVFPNLSPLLIGLRTR